MLGLGVLGSRTWMWTIAAPALAASRQEFAICSGVTGTAGLRPGVSAEPVTAQEIITFRAIVTSSQAGRPPALDFVGPAAPGEGVLPSAIARAYKPNPWSAVAADRPGDAIMAGRRSGVL